MLIKIYSTAPTGAESRYSPSECCGTRTQKITGNPDERKISTSAVALHFMHYNFARVHQSLRVTPAMEAGVVDHIWSLEEIVELLEDKTDGEI